MTTDASYLPAKDTRNGDYRAVEHLAELKQILSVSEESDVFWTRLVEGLAVICGSQFVFIVRKEDEVEQQQQQHHHQHQQLLRGLYFYYNDGSECVGLKKNRLFFGANPLSQVHYEKPCLMTEHMSHVMESSAGEIPFAAEAYLSIPLFSWGKCLAHLGLMWTDKGLQERVLSWTSMQLALHSLEDLVVQHLLLEMDNSPTPQDVSPTNLVHSAGLNVPHAVHSSPIHPFKPYARSLSHELRTPMQGIVGMLDVMHATVRESITGGPSEKNDGVFLSLKENIEMIQGEGSCIYSHVDR